MTESHDSHCENCTAPDMIIDDGHGGAGWSTMNEATEYLKRISDVLEAWAGGHFNYYPERERAPVANQPGPLQKTDIARLYDAAFRRAQDHGPEDFSRTTLALIDALRDAAMEAECMGEMSGFRVSLLARHGLTDSSDAQFGPVKYPDQQNQTKMAACWPPPILTSKSNETQEAKP